MTNVYTVLRNISCAEVVYQICKEIQWKTKNEFDNTVFRLGGLGVIGKQMDGSRFSEILENTSSYGPTKVKGNV